MIYIYIYLRQNGGMFNCTPDFLVKNMEVFLFLTMVTTFFKFSGCPTSWASKLGDGCFQQ